MSKHLVSILSSLVGNSSSFVKNSTDFASFATRIELPSNYILVSFDVVSLFTKIPVNRAKEISYKYFLADTTLEDRTMLSPDEVSRLLEFCLNYIFRRLLTANIRVLLYQ